MFIKNSELITMNNIVTGNCNWQLQQKQQFYKEKDKRIWRMDVKVINYHLNILNDMFNQGRIGKAEYENKFICIWSFEDGNHLLLKVLFLNYN